MSSRRIILLALATGVVLSAITTFIIHNRYEAALRREFEATSGQVGRLRVEADTLRTEQEDRRRELETIRGDIRTAEAALSTARQQAEDSQCHAQHARVDAAVTMKQVACYAQHAKRAECIAARESQRADDTMFGMLFGAGLAMATGGSSLLLTASGGMVGHASSGGPCPPPQCVLETKALKREVLTEQGLTRLPKCATPYNPPLLSETAFLGFEASPQSPRKKRP